MATNSSAPSHAPGTVSAYEQYARPLTARMLASIRLDAVYERAEGDYLWRRDGDRLVRVLDLVGGYGANLFGHHHPELVGEARRLIDAHVPILAQGSIREAAGRLAEALCRQLGDYIVILTNTGTETTEAAIKHLHLERARPVLWAVRGAFHGKTSGAVQLTWSQLGKYDGLGPRVRFIDPDDPADWQLAQSEVITRDDVAGAFLEPIQGEGGIRPLPASFVAWLAETCRLLGIPIVADEIQSGMGRTGTFLACERLGLDPDYVCLSKSLGGGLSKIGALLIRRSRFQEDFAVSHTSTFAEDDWSASLALKALEVLERDRLTERCAALGDGLLHDLEGLRMEFPGQIADVRGRGLMVGVELASQDDSPSAAIRALSLNGHLGWMAAAYLLNAHDIRVAPTISQPLTLRVEPSAYVAPDDLRRFVKALRLLCTAIRAGDAAHLTGFVVGRPTEPVRETAWRVRRSVEVARTAHRVAFLVYFTTPAQLRRADPSIGHFSDAEIDDLIGRTATVVGPTLSDRVHVRSGTGADVHLTIIGINTTAARVAAMRTAGDVSWFTEQIEAGVALARDEGCQVIGLGGYTSSVTASCLRIRTRGIALTSGNSLAVGMGIRALREGASRRGIDPKGAYLGVVGIPGNIASIYAAIMAAEVRGVVLVARTLSSPRLQSLVLQLRRLCPATNVEVSDSPAALRKCQLVVTATVGAGDLVQPEHLAAGPVVICDISVPTDIAASVATVRPDVFVIPGGIVRLADSMSLELEALDLRPGHVVACLAETLLMGLEGQRTHGSYGAVTKEGVERILALADRHGFMLADIEDRAGSGLHA